ncbi:TIGR03905 family TSCPD domain-containing protein [Oscillibacter sp.]|uniref:TIGR03905 family TSCPD domain-containing protein n=1 Tax=Oscillibacter sp. TaxID=1945593 RepID=UPI00261FCA79|nr:TIGR03905 family TSCPD domain-containing protein [Oscillibacter sp.]MDD3346637.1 TIGR03905 family TSCPD domain-containing protein [Oscillibacter sp.]
MTISFRPKGVCSQEMQVEVDDGGVIRDLRILGGCSGNLQGIAALVRDMPAQEAIRRLKGIRCGFKSTSCPDQLAQGLEKILSEAGKA